MIRNAICFWFLCYGACLLLSALNPLLYDMSVLASVKYVFPTIGLLFNLIYLYSVNWKFRVTRELEVLLVFLIVIGVSSIFSSDFVQSFSRFSFALITLLFIYTTLEVRPGLVNDVLAFFYWVGIPVCAACVYLFAFRFLEFVNAGNFRGIFYNANFFGMFLSLIMIPAILLRIWSSKQGVGLSKFFKFFYLVIALGLLFASRSRASLLAVVVLLVTCYIFYKPPFLIRGLKISVGVLISIAALGALFPEDFKYSIYQTYVIKHEGFNSIAGTRANMFSDRLLGIVESPVIGWGYGVKPQLSGIFAEGDKLTDSEKGNSYLAFIEEVGILMGGIFLCVFFVVTFFLTRWALRLPCGSLSRAAATLIGVLFAGLLHSNFESWLFYFGSLTSIYYWVVLLGFRSFIIFQRGPYEL